MTVHTLKPDAAGYRMLARNSDRGEIYLYGVIGDDFGGVSSEQFRNDLKKLGNVKHIDLRINSEGGSVFDGKAMYSLLNSHSAKVTVHIDGLAASAASFIAMAGDEIQISDGAFVMIHNAYWGVRGDAKEMRKAADLLDTVNNTIIDVYAKRTGRPRDEIVRMMDAETWMTADEAVKNGFATKVVGSLKVAASVSNPESFKNMPSALKPSNVRVSAALDRIAALKKI